MKIQSLPCWSDIEKSNDFSKLTKANPKDLISSLPGISTATDEL
jgi:hypothetical protein